MLRIKDALLAIAVKFIKGYSQLKGGVNIQVADAPISAKRGFNIKKTEIILVGYAWAEKALHKKGAVIMPEQKINTGCKRKNFSAYDVEEMKIVPKGNVDIN